MTGITAVMLICQPNSQSNLDSVAHQKVDCKVDNLV